MVCFYQNDLNDKTKFHKPKQDHSNKERLVRKQKDNKFDDNMSIKSHESDNDRLNLNVHQGQFYHNAHQDQFYHNAHHQNQFHQKIHQNRFYQNVHQDQFLIRLIIFINNRGLTKRKQV
jgi:hypothetical protein